MGKTYRGYQKELMKANKKSKGRNKKIRSVKKY